MSRENVEIVRAAMDALDRGDLPGAMKDMATDFRFDFSRSRSPERGVYGRDDLSRLQDAFTGVWESVRWEAEEFIEAGHQLVEPDRRRRVVREAARHPEQEVLRRLDHEPAGLLALRAAPVRPRRPRAPRGHRHAVVLER